MRKMSPLKICFCWNHYSDNRYFCFSYKSPNLRIYLNNFNGSCNFCILVIVFSAAIYGHNQSMEGFTEYKNIEYFGILMIGCACVLGCTM